MVSDDPETPSEENMTMEGTEQADDCRVLRRYSVSEVGKVLRTSLLGFPAFLPFWPVWKFYPGINVDTKGLQSSVESLLI
jgi:hypothetical protein